MRLGIVAAGSHRPEHFERLMDSIVRARHIGPVVVVDGSGTGRMVQIATTTEGADALDLSVLEWEPDDSSRRRWNAGARRAIEMGATHLAFPNDYQTVTLLSGHEPGLPDLPSEGTLGIARLRSASTVLTPPIYEVGKVTRNSPWLHRRAAWGSSLETLLVPSREAFEVTGGWSEQIGPHVQGAVAWAGDGLDWVCRSLNAGISIEPFPWMILNGGHRGPDRPQDDPLYIRYGQGAIQAGRLCGLPTWYLVAQTIRASVKGLVGQEPSRPELFGSKLEWKKRAMGMRRELMHSSLPRTMTR